MDLRSWIVLFPLTFLLASAGVVGLSPRALRRWSLFSPDEFSAAYRCVSFLTSLLFAAMLCPLWWLILRHHDHAVFFLIRRMGAHFFSLGLMANLRLTIYLSLLAVLFVWRAKHELSPRTAALESTSEGMTTQASAQSAVGQALHPIATMFCFAMMTLSADLLQMIVFAILGFVCVSRRTGTAAGFEELRLLRRNLHLLPLLVVTACALWLTTVARSSEAMGIQHELPAISTAALTWIMWLTLISLVAHIILGISAVVPLKARGVVGVVAFLCVWWLMDVCLFDRLILSTMPSWVLGKL